MEVSWTRVGAYVIVVDDDDRILLTRFRSPGHPDHGRWGLPGGGMEWGESARQTAERELREETGLTAALGPTAGTFSRWYTAEESVRGAAGHMIGVVFHASDPRGALRTDFDGDEVATTDAAGWFPIADVPALPRGELVDFVLDVLAGRGGRDVSTGRAGPDRGPCPP